MTTEIRIRHTAGGWLAEMRFDAPDEELFAKHILPGWHSFKRSVFRERIELSAMLAFAQAAEPKRFLA